MSVIPEIEGAPRRALLGAVLATGAVCAGCTTYGKQTPTPQGSDGPSGSVPPGTTTAGAAQGPVVLIPTTGVPVGGGTILSDRKIVLTQPTPGVFKAFTAVCTHAGCTVSTVESGTIVCPCHGSSYHIQDGSVANGPASKALAPVAITVAGGQISLA